MSLDDDWTERTFYRDTGYAEVLFTTYGDGYFLGAGEDGRVYYADSPEGPWACSTAGSRDLYGAHFADDTWVVVGDYGKIYTSPSATGPWTARTSGVDTAIYSVDYDGDTWVAVGGRKILTATDPTGAWSADDDADRFLYRIAHGGGDWVAAGVGPTNDIYLIYAADPTGTWTASTSANTGPSSDSSLYRALAYGDGKWMVAGPAFSGFTTTPVVKTATDPAGTWTNVTIGDLESPSNYGLAYLDGYWIATGIAADDDKKFWYATSPSATWNEQPMDYGAFSYASVAFDDGDVWAINGISNVVHQALQGDGWGVRL